MITQKDISRKTGVSISVVSRVLSGKAKEFAISDRTIEEVTKCAKQLGYIPNQAALALRGIETKTLGIVTYDFEDPYFGIIL